MCIKGRSKEAGKQSTKYHRLHQLWSHVWSDIVTSWWKCFAYTVALCSLVLAAASWYRQTQLEAVVKEYYIIKPVLKQDRKYAPLIHTMDSVILKDGIDEVCERVYGEKRWTSSLKKTDWWFANQVFLYGGRNRIHNSGICFLQLACHNHIRNLRMWFLIFTSFFIAIFVAAFFKYTLKFFLWR